MAAKHPHILRTTCTATALSVMLAACGGGGGSERDKAVSASPVAPRQTQNIVATAPTTPSITTPQNSPAATGQVNTPSVGQSNSVQPAPSAPQNQTTHLPPDHACSDAAGGTGRHQACPDADADADAHTNACANSGTQDGAQHFRQGRAWGCVVGDD